MKNILKNITALGLGLVAISTVACNDFEEINISPDTTTEENILPHFLLTKSMYEAQQNPHIAERIFIYYWNRGARYGHHSSTATKAVGYDSNGFNTDYLSLSYLGGWLNNATQAIRVAQSRIDNGTNSEATNNIMQISRIWRAYLFTEYADNFGGAPIHGYMGETATYATQKETYEFILSELADAVSKLETDAAYSSAESSSDLFYGGDAVKWAKYANSMRMRIAMRISSAAPAYAQAQFEAAAADLNKLITEQADIASVQEIGGWDPTTGVFTRNWNTQKMSLTMANLVMGLGGVDVSTIATHAGTALTGISAEDLANYSKDPSTYLGLKSNTLFSDKTNVQNAAYMFDYIPSKIDPRALVGYSIPGTGADNPVTWQAATNETVDVKLSADESDNSALTLRVKYSYFTQRSGDQGTKGSLFSAFAGTSANVPHRSKVYRSGDNKRVFFGPWETYFLIAEAAVKGWATPMSAEAAYEAGVTSSFTYFGLESFAAAYLQSEDLNMVGTSVKFSHTAEVASRTMQYVDIDSNLVGDGSEPYKISDNPTVSTVEYNFPKGVHAKNNDALTKIITQKYLAQSPWLPSEAWSDYRRLCLPFFENPVRENTLIYMPNYTDYSTANALNIGQRSAYPTNISGANAAGYATVKADLHGGVDDGMTPLWWSYAANN